jgi:hypothetical protein
MAHLAALSITHPQAARIMGMGLLVVLFLAVRFLGDTLQIYINGYILTRAFSRVFRLNFL